MIVRLVFFLLLTACCTVAFSQKPKCKKIFDEANELYLQDKRQLGLEKIGEFIDCDPKYWQGYHIKAMLVSDVKRLQRMHSPSLDENKYNEALSYLKEALKFTEDESIRSFINVDIVRLHKVYRKFEEAIALGKQYILKTDYKADKINLIFAVAGAYMRTNQKDSALAFNHKGLKEDSMFFASHLGYFFIRELQYDSAFKYLNIALKFDPDDRGAESNMAYCALETKHYKKAVQIYEKIKERVPQQFNSQNNLGLAYLYLGEMEKAKNNFMHVRKYYPWNSFLYRNWGIMNLQEGDSLIACRNFKLAKEIELDKSFLKEINKIADSYEHCSEVYSQNIKKDILTKVHDENSVLSEKETFAVATYLMLLSELNFKFEVYIDKESKVQSDKNILVFSTAKNNLEIVFKRNFEGDLSKSQINSLDKNIIAQRFPHKQYHYGIVEVLEKLYIMLDKK